MKDAARGHSDAIAMTAALPRGGFMGLLRGRGFAALLRVNTLLFVASMSTNVLTYLYHVVVGHMLGPVGYGTVAALINLSLIVLIPSTIVVTVMARAAAALTANHQMGQLHDLWARLTLWLLGAGLIAALVLSVLGRDIVAQFFQIGNPTAVGLLGLLFLTSFIAPLNQGVLQGTQRFVWLAIVTAVWPFLRVALAVVFIVAGWGVNGAVAALVVASAIPYAVGLWPLRVTLLAVPRVAVALRPWLSYSSTVAIATIANTLLYNVDTVLAKHFLSPIDAGHYAALATTGKIVLFVGGSVVTVMFPKVAAAHARGERHGPLLAFSMVVTLALSGCALLVFVVAPGFVLGKTFGAGFAVVRGDLVWYGLAMLLFAAVSVLMQYFLSLHVTVFLWVLGSACLGEIGALWLWHQDIAQMVAVMLATMAALLLGMVAVYVTWARRQPARV